MAGTPPSLLKRRALLAAPKVQRAELAKPVIGKEFREVLQESGLWPLTANGIEIFQVNVGKLCNQTCRHCHVDAGPDRREIMTRETMEQCLAALAKTEIPIVDITGGAPELVPDFRWFVEECRKLGRHVIDRCNLTIIETPSHNDLPEFFAKHKVEVICSLPHYRALNTDLQRGDGVYEKSIRGLLRLNALGYGEGDPDLRLVLVTNPVGAFLPGAQSSLEAEWKQQLWENHRVRFDALYTITNMPISRFLEWLLETDNLDGYLERLVTAFNPGTVPGLMCRNMISVSWEGDLYDCDFNQMLDIPVGAPALRNIRDFDLAALAHRRIEVDRHCFGCTAGGGSSCGGATA